jgi:hypothetical protein
MCTPDIRTPFCGRGDCRPPPQQPKTLVQAIFAISEEIRDGRTLSDVLNHTTSELGELAQEVIVANGRSYKAGGPDGIVGESVDVIICALDMIHLAAPSLTEEQILMIARRKLAKWKDPVKQYVIEENYGG